ncbi:unnamed protein product [Calypogeia fissa]
MGNTAMSSVGSMLPAGHVRVLVADGKVLHFAQPALAIQVMQEHPGHLVVKCTPSSMLSEMIREESYACLTYEKLKKMALKEKVAILRADEELDRRSTYYLLPIKANKKQAGFSFSCIFSALKNSGRVASSFEFERKSDSSSGKFSMLRRSRSLPRSEETVQHVEQQEEQPEAQQKGQQKLSPSVSFPARRPGRHSFSSPFMEGIGRSLELPLLRHPLHHKRPRRIRRPSQIGWRPILESISEVVGEFSDDEDYSGDFCKSQSKCLRRFHSFQSPMAHLRPVTV